MVTSDREAVDFECCPNCEATLEPEAETCGACGVALFDGEVYDLAPLSSVDPIEGLADDGSLAPLPPLDFQDLVPVFRGSLAEAIATRASLRLKGVAAWVGDESTKTIDPFITGGDVFSATVYAPRAMAERVVEALPGTPAKVFEPEEPEAEADRLVRWTVLALVVFPPAAVFVAVRFLHVVGTNRLRHRREPLMWVLLVVAIFMSAIPFAAWSLFGYGGISGLFDWL